MTPTIHAHRTGVAVLLAVLGTWVASAPAFAQGASRPDDTTSARRIGEFGESYWGTIPPRHQATPVARFERGKPGWARVVDLPYSVAFFPLKLTVLGVEESAQFLDEHPALARVLAWRFDGTLVTPGVSYGTQDGWGGSLSVDYEDFLAPDARMKFRIAGATKGNRKATLGISYPKSPLSRVEVGAGYRANQNTRFYGAGPASDEARESFYRQETSWGGVSYGRSIGSWPLSWSVGALVSGASAIGSDDSEDPHLSEEFAGELPVGYRKRSVGRSVSFEFRHDDTSVDGRPDEGRPERGGVRRARATYFESTGNDDAEFWTLRGELQQFVPLWFSKRALALRGYLAVIEPTRGDVPFQRLMTNDDEDAFRGYVDHRFRDRGITALAAEYRWPAWVLKNPDGFGADAYLFVDSGQVFPDIERVAIRDRKTSYGGGFRFSGYGMFVGRIELAKGDEGWQFRLGSEQIFQYGKAGLFHGRTPVPER